MFDLFRLCRKDEILFDIVAETGNIVAKTAKMSKQHLTLSKESSFDNVAGTLWLVWTGLNSCFVKFF